MLGLTGYFLDTYQFGSNGVFPSVDAFLEPYVQDIVGLLTPDITSVAAASVTDPVGDVIGALDATAFNPLESIIDGLVGSSTLF